MNETRRETTGAVIVAAGRSERMAGADKLWEPLADAHGRARPLLLYTLQAFQESPQIDRIALVVAPESRDRAKALVRHEGLDKVTDVVPGEARRRDSVRVGLWALEDCAWVAVHDGARPLVSSDLIGGALAAARETGAACCALQISDTVKESGASGRVVRTLDRSSLWLAQTPQVFRYDILLDAHERSEGEATDDASMVEELGIQVRLCKGAKRNMKVTTPEDFALVRALLQETK